MLRVGVRRSEKTHPPLLLFNGIGANIELIGPFLDALDGPEAVVFDVPGVGGSPAPWRPYRPSTLARLGARLLDQLGHERTAQISAIDVTRDSLHVVGILVAARCRPARDVQDHLLCRNRRGKVSGRRVYRPLCAILRSRPEAAVIQPPVRRACRCAARRRSSASAGSSTHFAATTPPMHRVTSASARSRRSG